MDDRIEHLTRLVDETENLLRRHGEQVWADRLEQDALLIRRLDFRGVEQLLGAFGGMGSFNDVVLCPENGHHIDPQEVDQVNARLVNLRSEIYRRADELRRNA